MLENGQVQGLVWGVLLSTLVYVPLSVVGVDVFKARRSKISFTEAFSLSIKERTTSIRFPTVNDLTSKGNHKGVELGLSMLVGFLGPWVLTSPSETGYWYGWTGVIFYDLACVIPLLSFIVVSHLYRRRLGMNGFSILDSLKLRCGQTVNTIVFANAWLILILSYVADFTSVQLALQAMVDIESGWIVTDLVLIGVITTAYSLIGGFKASLYTDVMQAVIILSLTLALSFIYGELFYGKVSEENRDLIYVFSSTGVTAGIVLNVACVLVTYADQTWWQRFYAARDHHEFVIAVFVCSILYVLVVTLMGWFGIIAAGLELEGKLDLVDNTGAIIFVIASYLESSSLQMTLIGLTTLCAASSVDSKVLAMGNMIGESITKRAWNLNWAKLFGFASSMIGLTIAVSQPKSVLEILYIGNLIACLTTPTVLLLAWKRLNKYGALSSIVAAILTVQTCGWIVAKDFVGGFSWWVFPYFIGDFETGGFEGWPCFWTYASTITVAFTVAVGVSIATASCEPPIPIEATGSASLKKESDIYSDYS